MTATAARARVPGGPWLPVAALAFNAAVWGLSWAPLRWLQAHGLHPLWATALIYALAVAAITAWRPHAWARLRQQRSLWLLVAASGVTNAAFNWAVTIGDVVRVVLLFYLMPLWAALLARWLLNEPLTRSAAARMVLAVGGAAVVLWPDGGIGGGPWPRTLAEGLGVVGGFTFALNNVLLRRHAAAPESARALAMFVGGAAVAGALATALTLGGRVAAPPPLALPWLAGALALGAAFIASNLALQHGAARLPAQVTAVVMVSEVLFASVSAVALGASTPTPTLLIGGALIVAASVLAAGAAR